MGAMGGGGGGGGPPLDGGGGGGGGPAFPPGGGGGGGGGGIGPTSVSSLQKEKSLESKEFRKESSMTKTGGQMLLYLHLHLSYFIATLGGCLFSQTP